MFPTIEYEGQAAEACQWYCWPHDWRRAVAGRGMDGDGGLEEFEGVGWRRRF